MFDSWLLIIICCSFEKDQILANLEPTVSYEHFKDCDIIVEAVFEDKALKHKVVREVEQVYYCLCFLMIIVKPYVCSQFWIPMTIFAALEGLILWLNKLWNIASTWFQNLLHLRNRTCPQWKKTTLSKTTGGNFDADVSEILLNLPCFHFSISLNTVCLHPIHQLYLLVRLLKPARDQKRSVGESNIFPKFLLLSWNGIWRVFTKSRLLIT